MKAKLLRQIRRKTDHEYIPQLGWIFWKKNAYQKISQSLNLNVALINVVKFTLGKHRAGTVFVKNLKV